MRFVTNSYLSTHSSLLCPTLWTGLPRWGHLAVRSTVAMCLELDTVDFSGLSFYNSSLFGFWYDYTGTRRACIDTTHSLAHHPRDRLGHYRRAEELAQVPYKEIWALERREVAANVVLPPELDVGRLLGPILGALRNTISPKPPYKGR